MKVSKSVIGPLLVVVAAILWSTDSVFRYPLTQEISPTLIVFGEHLLGAALLLPIIIRAIPVLRSLTLREWGSFLFIAVGGSVVATIAFTASFSHVSPSVAILLQKTQPIITLLLAALILKERLPKHFWVWAIIAIGGAYVVSFPEIVPNLTIYEGGTIGIVYALIAAFFWGGSTVFGRIMLKRVSYQQLTGLRLGVGALVLFAILGWQGAIGTIGTITASQLAKLMIIVLVPGTVALLIYYRGLTNTKASVSTLAELAWPFSAVIINWFALGQTLTWVQIAGGLVLLGAITKLTLLNQKITDQTHNAEVGHPATGPQSIQQ